MRVVAKSLDRWWVFWPLFFTYIAFALMPARFWFEPGLQTVTSGDEVSVTQERIIHRDFLGEYHVIVRKARGLDPICDGSGGPFTYRKNDGSKPAEMGIEDWAGGSCGYLLPGEYTMETCWTVLRPLWGIVPPKTVCVTSNTFEIGRSE